MVSSLLASGEENSYWDAFLPDILTVVELFGMHMRSVQPNWTYPSHEHLHYEINYLIEGEQITTVNGVSYCQRERDIVLIPPCTPHFSRVGQVKPMTYFCIHFIVEDKVFLPLLSRIPDVLHTPDSPFSKAIRTSVEQLVELARLTNRMDTSATHRMQTQSKTLQLMAKISEYLSSLESNLPHDPSLQLAQKIEEKIFTYLNAVTIHGQPINHHAQISAIADELGIHPSYCNRIFRKVYGLSPRQYLSELVLNHAKTMLIQLDLPIERIALLLGYSDISQFSRQFKRWTGESPIQYRHTLMKD